MKKIILLLVISLFPVSGYAQTVNGQVTTSPPTYYNNAFQPLSLDTSGNLRTTNIPSSSSSTGITPCVAGSNASSCILKASAGNLYSVYATPSSVAGYLMVFNSTTAPSNGSTTAGTAPGNLVQCVYVPYPGTTSISFNPGPPGVFSTGITAVFSSTACGTLTASATAFIVGSAQ